MADCRAKDPTLCPHHGTGKTGVAELVKQVNKAIDAKDFNAYATAHDALYNIGTVGFNYPADPFNGGQKVRLPKLDAEDLREGDIIDFGSPAELVDVKTMGDSTQLVWQSPGHKDGRFQSQWVPRKSSVSLLEANDAKR